MKSFIKTFAPSTAVNRLTQVLMKHHSSPRSTGRWLLAVAFSLSLFAASAADYQPPNLMNFQGYLEDGNGRPYGKGAPENKELVFRIYKDATSNAAGDLIWTERQVVTLDNGTFSVQLGNGTQEGSEAHGDLADAFKNNVASDRYLEIAVVGASSTNKISPRLRFLTTPYAHLATQANKLIHPTTGAEFDPFNPTVATSISSTIQSIAGNARGTGATDLQVVRTTDSQVASGDNSTIGGGKDNTASGLNSVVTGGIGNRASGQYSWVGGGLNSFADGWYSVVAGGLNNQIGTDSHYSSILGGVDNGIVAGVVYATLAGGQDNDINFSIADWGTIGGGRLNKNGGQYATIAGGRNHNISEDSSSSTIGGGYLNSVTGVGDYSVIAGGRENTANGDVGVIGGGKDNTTAAGASYVTIGGGRQNTVNNDYGTVSGGYANTISSIYGTIGGGTLSTLSGDYATIGGGKSHEATNDYATIGGGEFNDATGEYSTVAGGFQNAATGNHSTVAGGHSNSATNLYATIPGGQLCVAGGWYSLAAGRRARALHHGAFVYADITDADFESTANNQFSVRASGGVRFATTAAGTVGAELAAGATSWTTLSDRNRKKQFAPVDGEAVLLKLEGVPVTAWRYDWEEESSVKHIGPVAQDFKQAFYPGRDDKSITTLEMDGVALAAIKGLKVRDDQKNQRISELENENTKLKETLEGLLKRVQALEAKTN